MGCCLFILILMFPRVALALLFFLSTYLNGPYRHNFLVLILGFVFLPLTTLVYAFMYHAGMPVEGINILWLMIAAVVDLGMVGGGYRHHRSGR